MNALRRIFTLFNKDLKENFVVIVILMSIPVLTFFIPKIFKAHNIKVCIVTSQQEKTTLGFKPSDVIFESCHSNGMKLLDENKIQAVINTDSKIVYTYSKDPETIIKLKTAVSISEAPLFEINIVNKGASEKNYHALLCTILIIMVGLIGNPIVILSENKDNIISYLMLSPLSYFEFIISKALFSFVCSIVSLYGFLIIIGQFNTNPFALFCLVVATSLFITMVSAIISLPFNSVEEMMPVSSPLTLLIIFAQSISFGSGNIAYLPIQSGFRDTFAINVVPKSQIFILLSMSAVLFLIYVYLYRKIKRA